MSTPGHRVRPAQGLHLTGEFTNSGLVVEVLDSGLQGRRVDTLTELGSLLKLMQFHSHQFASVYSAASEYECCCEGTSIDQCPIHEGQYNCTAVLAFKASKGRPYSGRRIGQKKARALRRNDILAVSCI